jgi:hypothetical protein
MRAKIDHLIRYFKYYRNVVHPPFHGECSAYVQPALATVQNTGANKFRTHVWALIVKPWLPYREAFDSGQTSLTGDDKMATASDLPYGPQGPTPDSLQALAAYLELSLDKGKCVVMMRHGKDVCSVYVGDPANEEDVLTGHGTLSVAVADEILELTQVGVNRMTLGDQTYRFFRSFTHISDVGAVIFAPA